MAKQEQGHAWRLVTPKFSPSYWRCNKCKEKESGYNDRDRPPRDMLVSIRYGVEGTLTCEELMASQTVEEVHDL
jgi:hypothetical protein